jgi:hypothetical protein
MTQETAAQNIKNQRKSSTDNETTEDQEQTNKRANLPEP